MAKYMSDVAQRTKLTYCPKQGPWKGGAAIGARDGYVVAVGPARKNNRNAMMLLVRCKQANPELTRQAIATSPAVLAALGVSDFGKKQASHLVCSKDSVQWTWDYSFSKPSAEKLGELLTALIGAMQTTAARFEGRCEDCDRTSTSEITMLNGVPGYHCDSCVQELRRKQDAAALAYQNLPSNFPQGLLVGIFAAFAGSVAWGLVAYSSHKIFLVGAIGIGLLVTKAVYKGMGKINLAGQLTAGLLTVASVMCGDLIYLTLSVMREFNRAFSAELLGKLMTVFWPWEFKNMGSMAFALIGAVAVVWGSRPKFNVKVEKLAPQFAVPSSRSATA